MSVATGTKSIADINRDYFDSVSSTAWKEDWIQDFAKYVIEALQKDIEWLEIPSKNDTSQGVKLLDYACGNGCASMALLPYVTNVRGIDIAPGMVAQFNQTATRIGLSHEQMHGVTGNLLADEQGDSLTELFGFDVVIMSMALHHVQEADVMLRRLADRAKPGGTIVIVDVAGEVLPSKGAGQADETLEEVAKTVAHKHGFTEDGMMAMLARAGLVHAGYRLADKTFMMPPQMGGEKRIFVAKAKKPLP